MIPLMEIRDYLSETVKRVEGEEYDYGKYRMSIRRNGAEGAGPYWPKIRKHILEQVLKAQRVALSVDEDMRLITYQELVGIQVQWHRDFIFEYSVADIYNQVFDKKIDIEGFDQNIELEKKYLEKACAKHPSDVTLINNLLKAQKNKTLMVKKMGLQDDLERVIDEHVNPKYTKHYDENQ